MAAVQQAQSSGYLNLAITTIKKRFEILSFISWIVAAMYKGNITSYISYLVHKTMMPEIEERVLWTFSKLMMAVLRYPEDNACWIVTIDWQQENKYQKE